MIKNLINQINLLQPLWWLGVRIFVAMVFWDSGLVKISDFDTTIALFQDEYKVPIIPPFIAAIFSTFFELTCSVLIIIGLCTRLAAIPLLVMTAVIQFTYMQHIEHIYWAIVLTGLILTGAGKISVDYFIARKFCS